MVVDADDHAHEVAVVVRGRRARRAQAQDLELGRRLARHAVDERRAVAEPVARPARLPDRQPVVAAAAAGVVGCEAHRSSPIFSSLLCPSLPRFWSTGRGVSGLSFAAGGGSGGYFLIYFVVKLCRTLKDARGKCWSS